MLALADGTLVLAATDLTNHLASTATPMAWRQSFLTSV